MTYFDKFLIQGLSKYYYKKIMILKDFFKSFFTNFQKYSWNISPTVVTKAIKKQVGVVHAILFALMELNIELPLNYH